MQNNKFRNSEFPRISILTPVLNGMKYLDECIESVKAQNYPNLEHVFADGGSTDGTLERLFKEKSVRPNEIVIVHSGANGVGAGLNSAYKSSTGEIIGWLDADDRLEKDALEHVSKHFSGNQAIDFIYGQCNLIDESSQTIGSFVIREFDKREWINRWHYIVFCATFFRRNVIETVGFVNDLGNDVDFFLKVAKKFQLKTVNELLASWRFHSSGISMSPSKRETKIRKARARQDFIIVVKNRGSFWSPKSLIYVLAISNDLYKKFEIVLRPLRKVLKKIQRLFEVWVAESSVSDENDYFKSFISKSKSLVSSYLAKRHSHRRLARFQNHFTASLLVKRLRKKLLFYRLVIQHIIFYISKEKRGEN